MATIRPLLNSSLGNTIGSSVVKRNISTTGARQRFAYKEIPYQGFAPKYKDEFERKKWELRHIWFFRTEGGKDWLWGWGLAALINYWIWKPVIKDYIHDMERMRDNENRKATFTKVERLAQEYKKII